MEEDKTDSATDPPPWIGSDALKGLPSQRTSGKPTVQDWSNFDGLVARKLTLKQGEQTVVSNVSFSIPQGSLVALVGPNGGGKSTLLDALATRTTPYRGYVGGKSGAIAYLPQRASMDLSFPLSVRDIVGSGLWPRLGFFRPFTRLHQKAVSEALRAAGMSAFASHPISELSGGQFQRALFARLIVQGGDTLLLDEPFTGVDMPTIDTLMKLVNALNKEGRTLIITLHDIDLVRSFFPYTLLLARDFWRWGRTKTVLTPPQLSEAYINASNWSTCAC